MSVHDAFKDENLLHYDKVLILCFYVGSASLNSTNLVEYMRVRAIKMT